MLNFEIFYKAQLEHFRVCDVYYGDICFEAFIFGRDDKHRSKDKQHTSIDKSTSQSTLDDRTTLTHSLETLSTEITQTEYTSDESQVPAFVSDGTTYFHYPPGPMNPRVGFSNPYMYPQPQFTVLPPNLYVPTPQYIPPMQSGFNGQNVVPPVHSQTAMPQAPNPYMQQYTNFMPQQTVPNTTRSKASRRRQRQKEKKRAEKEAQKIKHEEREHYESKSSTNVEPSKKNSNQNKIKDEGSDKSGSSGVYPIMIPTDKGLVPRFVNYRCLTIIQNIADEFQESPDESSAGGSQNLQTETSETDVSMGRQKIWKPGCRDQSTSNMSKILHQIHHFKHQENHIFCSESLRKKKAVRGHILMLKKRRTETKVKDKQSFFLDSEILNPKKKRKKKEKLNR